MQKITLKELTLKKDCDAFIYNFCTASVDFFLLLLIHEKNNTSKLAFFEEGATFSNYNINLNKKNTRTLLAKSYEFECSNDSLDFSFILLENHMHQALSRAKVKKIIHLNTSVSSKNKGIQFHQIIRLNIPTHILQNENDISFNNNIFSIKFSLKK